MNDALPDSIDGIENTSQDESKELITVNIVDLRNKSVEDLLKFCDELNIEAANGVKHELLMLILKKVTILNGTIISEGVLDIVNDGFGFIRYSNSNYSFASDNVHVGHIQVKRFGLRAGDKIKAIVRIPRKNEKYISIHKIIAVNGNDDANFLKSLRYRPAFDDLIPIYPQEKFAMNYDLSTRCIDLISPMGKGQRSLIVAPPRTGKTVLLQSIAHSITANHPETELIVLLIGERPEEVTDMVRSVKGEVISSTFDDSPSRHVHIAELVIERAKRMVEDKKDVVILLDSVTRLARAYNVVAPSSGKILTGGLDSNALQKPKSFFGAARNIENGGSLTIIATALVDMGGKMDDFIFEEFKGTGNMEVYLDRKIADKRIYPAIDPIRSGTRREELLMEKDILQKHWILRRLLAQMSPQEAMDFLINKVRNSKDNNDFFIAMNS